MTILYYEIVFQMTVHAYSAVNSWFLGLDLHSWIKAEEPDRRTFYRAELTALNANRLCYRCCIFIDCINVSGVALPFNRVASVSFCLNLTFCLIFYLQFNRYAGNSILLISHNNHAQARLLSCILMLSTMTTWGPSLTVVSHKKFLQFTPVD